MFACHLSLGELVSRTFGLLLWLREVLSSPLHGVRARSSESPVLRTPEAERVTSRLQERSFLLPIWKLVGRLSPATHDQTTAPEISAPNRARIVTAQDETASLPP